MSLFHQRYAQNSFFFGGGADTVKIVGALCRRGVPLVKRELFSIRRTSAISRANLFSMLPLVGTANRSVSWKRG